VADTWGSATLPSALTRKAGVAAADCTSKPPPAGGVTVTSCDDAVSAPPPIMITVAIESEVLRSIVYSPECKDGEYEIVQPRTRTSAVSGFVYL
jgi:hypothetical protein